MKFMLLASLCLAALLGDTNARAAPAPSRPFVRNLSRAVVRAHAKGGVVKMLASPALHGNKHAFVAILSLPAGGKVPEHRDVTEEYLYVLAGGGTIWIEGKRYPLRKDDLVFMPASAKVRFVAGKKGVRVLQIFAEPGPEKKYEAWKTRGAGR